MREYARVLKCIQVHSYGMLPNNKNLQVNKIASIFLTRLHIMSQKD